MPDLTSWVLLIRVVMFDIVNTTPSLCDPMNKTRLGLMTLNAEEVDAARVLNNLGFHLRKYGTLTGVWFGIDGAHDERILSTPKFARVKKFVMALVTNERPPGVKAARWRALSARRSPST